MHTKDPAPRCSSSQAGVSGTRDWHGSSSSAAGVSWASVETTASQARATARQRLDRAVSVLRASGRQRLAWLPEWGPVTVMAGQVHWGAARS